MTIVSAVLGSSLIVTFSLAALLAGCCLTAGLLIGIQIGRPGTQSEETVDVEDVANRESINEVDSERVKSLLLQLHGISAGVAGNVREHNDAIQTITKELQDGAESPDGFSKGAVFQAIASIVEANSTLQSRLTEATTTIEKQAQEIQCQLEEALTDSLTQIANRRAFDHEMERRMAEFRRNGVPVTLMLLDVDHFKKFNDRYGHQTGDDVLRGVARVLELEVREVDLPTRYGGEEFGIVLPQTTLTEAQAAAERVRSAIETTQFQTGHGSLQVTVSVGLAIVAVADELAGLIARADEALYAAKHAGRNRCFYHDGSQCQPIPATLGPEGEATGAKEMSRSAATPKLQLTTSEESGEESHARQDVAPDETAHHDPSEALDRTDRQTGLPNRLSFTEALNRRLAECRRQGTTVSIVLLEIDKFQSLRRSRGKEAVRVVLQNVPRFLATGLRETDLLARFDDSMFALLLPSSEIDGAAIVANRVRLAVGNCDKLRLKDETIRVTLSAGVAKGSGDDGTASLIGRAQLALHAANERGGNHTFACDGLRCEDMSECRTASAERPTA